MSKPKYKNDCKGCKFLTHEGEYDVSFHEFDSIGAILVFQYGNNKHDYISIRLNTLTRKIDERRTD